MDGGLTLLSSHQETQLGRDSSTLRPPLPEGSALAAWALKTTDQFRGHPREEHTLHMYSYLLLIAPICVRNSSEKRFFFFAQFQNMVQI